MADYRSILKFVQRLWRTEELWHILLWRLVVANQGVFQSWGHASLSSVLRADVLDVESNSLLRRLAVQIGVVRLRQHEVSLLRNHLHSFRIVKWFHALRVSNSVLLDVHDINLLVIGVALLNTAALGDSSLRVRSSVAHSLDTTHFGCYWRILVILRAVRSVLRMEHCSS